MRRVSLVLACLPYLTAAVLLLGLARRLLRWSRAPAPPAPLFPLPDVGAGPAWRGMVLELGLLRGRRSLDAPTLPVLCLHYALALILLGHIRTITDFPRLWAALTLSPRAVDAIGAVLGTAAGLVALGACVLMACRRLRWPRLRAISRFEDFFVLALLAAVLATGLYLRLGTQTALGPVREYWATLLSLSPRPMPETPGFALHFLLAQALIAIWPYGKLLHIPGVLFAKTGLGRDAPPAAGPPVR